MPSPKRRWTSYRRRTSPVLSDARLYGKPSSRAKAWSAAAESVLMPRTTASNCAMLSWLSRNSAASMLQPRVPARGKKNSTTFRPRCSDKVKVSPESSVRVKSGAIAPIFSIFTLPNFAFLSRPNLPPSQTSPCQTPPEGMDIYLCALAGAKRARCSSSVVTGGCSSSSA